MNRKYFTSIFLLLALLQFTTYANPKIDPIRFSIGTTATQVSLNEEFEIKISAKYLNIPSSVAFVFEGSNSFKLKLIMPAGFVQTGGDFQDFTGTELTKSKPSVSYTLRGKFVSSSDNGVFQLLRSHKNSDNQSTFIEVGRLSFALNKGGEVAANEPAARIMLSSTPGYVPYMTIAQLRAGLADTAKVVYVIDHGKTGMFRLDSSSTSPDDGVLTVISGSGNKYERIVDEHVNPRWWGIIGDGVTDETLLWQNMIDNPKVSSIYFRKSKVSYRIDYIRIPSNKTLIFEEGCDVFGLGKLPQHRRMITIREATNVVIRGYNAVFRDMQEEYPTGVEGQFNGCFFIGSSSNIIIEGVTVKDLGGDGFYLGTTTYGITNTNIKLLNITVDNAQRNGISVINGDGVWINNPKLVNIRGSAPQFGIDLEPNNNTEMLRGIRITNPYTANNGGGILVATHALANSLTPVDIVIDNHVDDGSTHNFTIQDVQGPVLGGITINNPIWKNAKLVSFLAFNYSVEGAQVKVNNPTVLNSNSVGEFYELKAAFLFYRHSGKAGQPLLGNIHVYNPTVLDTRNPRPSMPAFFYRDGFEQTSKWTNCSVINPLKIEIADSSKIIVTQNVLEFPVFQDIHGVSVKDLANDDILVISQYNEASNYYKLIHNKSSSNLRTVTLSHKIPNQAEVTVEVKSASTLRVSPVTAWSFKPLAGINQSIQSNVVGSKIRFVKENQLASWTVKEITGVWTDTTGNVIYGKSPNVISTVTSNVTLTSGPSTVLANVSAGSRTVTLPPAANAKGTEFVIKKIDATANTVTVKPNGSELVDGVASKVISTQWDVMRVQSNGVEWYIIK